MNNPDDKKRLAFNRIKTELDRVSNEMLTIINKYDLQVDSPLDVIATAKAKITDGGDYIKFIELSLQGRLLGEAVSHLDSGENNSSD